MDLVAKAQEYSQALGVPVTVQDVKDMFETEGDMSGLTSTEQAIAALDYSRPDFYNDQRGWREALDNLNFAKDAIQYHKEMGTLPSHIDFNTVDKVLDTGINNLGAMYSKGKEKTIPSEYDTFSAGLTDVPRGTADIVTRGFTSGPGSTHRAREDQSMKDLYSDFFSTNKSRNYGYYEGIPKGWVQESVGPKSFYDNIVQQRASDNVVHAYGPQLEQAISNLARSALGNTFPGDVRSTTTDPRIDPNAARSLYAEFDKKAAGSKIIADYLQKQNAPQEEVDARLAEYERYSEAARNLQSQFSERLNFDYEKVIEDIANRPKTGGFGIPMDNSMQEAIDKQIAEYDTSYVGMRDNYLNSQGVTTNRMARETNGLAGVAATQDAYNRNLYDSGALGTQWGDNRGRYSAAGYGIGPSIAVPSYARYLTDDFFEINDLTTTPSSPFFSESLPTQEEVTQMISDIISNNSREVDSRANPDGMFSQGNRYGSNWGRGFDWSGGYSGNWGYDSPSEGGGRFGGYGLGSIGGNEGAYSGSKDSGLGGSSGTGFGGSRGGNEGAYSGASKDAGLGGRSSTSSSSASSSSPSRGGNEGSYGSKDSGFGGTSSSSSSSGNSTGVSGYTGGGYNNENSFGGPR